MDLQSMSGQEMLALVGEPVRITLLSRAPPIEGTVYTIDPESHSVVLHKEMPGKAGLDFVLIPGQSLASITLLNDAEKQPIDAKEAQQRLLRNIF